MGLTRVSVMRLVAWERGQGEGIMWGSPLGVTWGTWYQVVIREKSQSLGAIVWEGPVGASSNPRGTSTTLPKSPRHPHRGPRRGSTLTADNVLHHLLPELHPNLVPLARAIQIAGQDDHGCQGAQRLFGAASGDPQQSPCFSGCQAAQDGLSKDVTCQVGMV